MDNLVPDNIVRATEYGHTAVVQRWLANGGDPNQDIQSQAASGLTYWHNFRLLLLATSNGRTDIVRLLLEHGADVNYVFQEPAPAEDSDGDEDYICDNLTALDVASTAIHRTHSVDLIRLLLDNGAVSRIVPPALSRPYLLRVLLAAGADINARSCHGETPETWLRRFLAREEFQSPGDRDIDRLVYGLSLRILEGTRLAGSYKNYVLQEFKELLRLRSLLARGRAHIGPATPEAAARLFGGRTAGRARPPTRRHRPAPSRTQGVPDPVFWKVMEYWRLGDWRHP